MKTNKKPQNNQEIIAQTISYPKLPLTEIIDQSKNINPSKIAEEVLVWTALNVENFIDSTQKIFKLDIILDTEGETCSMPETKKLQNLYRSIPDDEDLVSAKMLNSKNAMKKISKNNKAFKELNQCREILDGITAVAFQKMKESHEILDKLYKRMIFYYEMRGVHNGKPIIQELNGGVDVLKFEYESFAVGVKIRAPDLQNVNDINNVEEMKENMSTVKEYIIPEGFTIWIEIAFSSILKQPSLF